MGWFRRDDGGLRGTSRLKREPPEPGDMMRFSVGLVTLAVEIGNLVSGPLLRSRRWPLLSVKEIRLPGPGLGALERLLLLRCNPLDCACWAAAIARWRSIMFSRLLDSSVLIARL